MQVSKLLMIRPTAFGYNPETAASNVFQKNTDLSALQVQSLALHEFNEMVKLLEQHEIDLYIFEDIFHNADAVFPNNWISFHDDGTVVLYPMMAESRRKERRTDFLEMMRKEMLISRIIDLTGYEEEEKFLEGTGSIVFDHVNKTAYACISPRTNKDLFITLCKAFEYTPVTFSSSDENGVPVYHTNVMMCLADDFAVLCLESIKNERQRDMLKSNLQNTGRQPVDINHNQMRAFAGNALYVRNKRNEPFLIISDTAVKSLEEEQLRQITSRCKIITPHVPTIETCGGGSVRCMIADVHLPLLKL